MTQLAELAGCDRGTISNAESAKVHILEENLTNIFDALEVSAAERARLFETGLAVGSPEFRAKTLILRGLLQGDIDAKERDIHTSLSRFENDQFRELSITPKQLTRVLETLIADGHLKRLKNGDVVAQLDSETIKASGLAEYQRHIRSMIDRLFRWSFVTHDELNNEFQRLLNKEGSLHEPEDFYSTVETVQLLMAGDDPFLTRITVAYAEALQQLHSVVYAAVEEEKRADFHDEFVTATVAMLNHYAERFRNRPHLQDMLIIGITKYALGRLVEKTKLQPRFARDIDKILSKYLPTRRIVDLFTEADETESGAD